MKILFINPTQLNENKVPMKFKKGFGPPLSFSIFNALTPQQHTIDFINDIVEDIPYEGNYDLVAITSMTMQVERAYQIADAFRSKGVTVIMGGMHATVLPDEVKLHADAVCIGEAENIWQQILDDCESNRLKDFYKDSAAPDLLTPVIPTYDNINLDIYIKNFGKKKPAIPLFATRGCPFGCKFCSITKFYGKKFRTKPIEHVLSEIDSTNAELYSFIDDNIVFKPSYAKELFTALKKKDIGWMSQASTTLLKHPELIELSAQAGCFSYFIGTESINADTLASVNKKFNKAEEYVELFQRLSRAGIMPIFSFIFGFDEDGYDQFRLTLDFLKKNKIYYAIFWILTPHPGTDIHTEMVAENRIHNNSWSDYGASSVVFKPKQFSEKELHDGYWNAYQEFYSYNRIIPHAIEGFKTNKKSWWVFWNNIMYQTFFVNKVNNFEHPYSGGFGKIG